MAMTGFSYRLTWNDFVGRVPTNADAGTAAFVSTRLSAEAPWTYAERDGVRAYKINSVACAVSLTRSGMWARPGARTRTDAILLHEQGHFDISALIVREVDQALTALLSQTFSTEADVMAAIDDARNSPFSTNNDLQSQPSGDGTYDTSTNHGLGSNQAAWTRAFAACRAAPTGRLVASLTAQGISI